MCVTGSRWFLVNGEMTCSVFVKEQQEVELGTITATTLTTTLHSHVHTYGKEVLSSQTKPIPSNSLVHFFLTLHFFTIMVVNLSFMLN